MRITELDGGQERQSVPVVKSSGLLILLQTFRFERGLVHARKVLADRLSIVGGESRLRRCKPLAYSVRLVGQDEGLGACAHINIANEVVY